MRILIATDAFRPQVNGVVQSLEQLAEAAKRLGVGIEFLSPQGFPTIPLPTYAEIRLALTGARGVADRVAALEEVDAFDHIHIATEGPIGYGTRRYCLRRKRAFTTSYHTRFPEYISARSPVPEALVYALLRRFHSAADVTMAATPSLICELGARGFPRLMRWSRGVDCGHFHPAKRRDWHLPRPIFLYVGRLALEKNLDAFLSLDLPGSKVVVGNGPSADSLRRAYPVAHFLGLRKGEELARIYASADAFVFPSRTDTFGIVLLEAMASGLPVAAFPVSGPIDVVGEGGAGVLGEDLRVACLAALAIPRERVRAHAETFTWETATRQFLANVATAKAAHATRAQASSKSAGKQRRFLREIG